MKEKVAKLILALNKANKAALSVKDTEDCGTCNFDSPIIKLPRWTTADIVSVEASTAISIGDKLSGWNSGYRFVGTAAHGQANCRTAMAEAACKSLKEDGYDVAMYYAMD